MLKPLNVGMIGYGFMGRAHSNAYRKVNNFFDLEHQPVLKAVCARSADKAKAFADKWGYESVETDWRRLLERKVGFIEETGAKVVATGNPGCLAWIEQGLAERDLAVDVKHPVEILDAAYRAA